MNISIKDLLLDIPRILADFIAGYDIYTLYKYGGNLMFYPEILNRGAIPAYNVLIEINKDDEKVFENVCSVLNVEKPYIPYHMYMINDGKYHSYAVGITVLRSLHKNKRNKVSGFLYKIDETGLDITFDYFTRNPTRLIFPPPNI